MGTPELLAAVIKLIQSDGPSLGLHINLEKSEVVYLNKKVESDDFTAVSRWTLGFLIRNVLHLRYS